MPRPNRGQIAFMGLWLVLWTAGLLAVLWSLGGAAVRGELGVAGFLLLWLAVAGLGLWLGARRLARLIAGPAAPAPPHPRHAWTEAEQGVVTPECSNSRPS